MSIIREQIPFKGGLSLTVSSDPKHPGVIYTGEAQVRVSSNFVHRQSKDVALVSVPSITFVGLQPGVYEVSVSSDIAVSGISQVEADRKKLLYGVHGVGNLTRYSAFDNLLTDGFTVTSPQELIIVRVSAHMLGSPASSLPEASDALFFTSLVLAAG
jgi:hypothetical protein